MRLEKTRKVVPKGSENSVDGKSKLPDTMSASLRNIRTVYFVKTKIEKILKTEESEKNKSAAPKDDDNDAGDN